jgi:hypothetical protein
MVYDLSKKTRAGNKTDQLQGRAAAGYRERGEPGAKIKAKRSVDSVSANYFCKQAKGKGKRVECGVATWAGRRFGSFNYLSVQFMGSKIPFKNLFWTLVSLKLYSD